GAEPVALPLEICVRDNGPGVAPEILSNLFDPFVSTKAQGSGLGLALVAKLVGDHGGVIECESHPRKTTFRVLMPVHSPRAAPDAMGRVGRGSRNAVRAYSHRRRRRRDPHRSYLRAEPRRL